jgi:hypothetical protein
MLFIGVAGKRDAPTTGAPPNNCTVIKQTTLEDELSLPATERPMDRGPERVNHYRNAMAASCLLSLQQHSGSVLMHCSKF